jgi:hypothetical protein
LRHLGPLLLAGAAVGAGCGREPAPADTPATAQQPLSLSPAALGAEGHDTEADRPVPRGLRAAYLQQRQREAGPAHALSSQGGALLGRSPEQGLELRLDRSGVTLSAPSPADRGRAAAWQVRTALASFSCGAVKQPLDEATPRLLEPAAGTASATGVRYGRGRGLTEWYLNGPMGLEQGFTVEQPPDCGGAAPELRFDVSLATALSVRDRGDTLELFDEGGIRRASYGELYAADADGTELPSRLTWDPASRTVRLHVDARGARYPLRIDPLWSEQSKLVPFDGTRSHYFASDVAISGDTAVIGAAPALVGLVGKAYVFVRSGGVWTGQRVLTASDGNPDDNFGAAVAISGDTILVGAVRALVGGRFGAGKTYVFRRSGTPPVWTQEAVLTSLLTASGDAFGSAVAISGDTALVGVCGADVAGRDAAGQAEVFVRSGTSWTRQAVLTPPDAEQWGFFGCAAALHGDTALIGAYGADPPAGPTPARATSSPAAAPPGATRPRSPPPTARPTTTWVPTSRSPAAPRCSVPRTPTPRDSKTAARPTSSPAAAPPGASRPCSPPPTPPPRTTSAARSRSRTAQSSSVRTALRRGAFRTPARPTPSRAPARAGRSAPCSPRRTPSRCSTSASTSR